MRRVFTIITLVLVALTSSCVSSNDESIATPQPMVNIAVTAEQEDTRLALDGNTTRWEVGDSMTLGLSKGYGNTLFSTLSITSSSDISEDGKRATFRGTVAEGSYYAIFALYPATTSTGTHIMLDRAATHNIFMSSLTRYESNPIVITEGSKIPVALSHLMHKMDFKLSLAEGYVSSDLEADNITIEMSATANGTDVEFITAETLDIRTNTLSAAAYDTHITTHGSGSEFSTMLFPLSKLKDVVLTFTIYIDGERRYEVRKPDSGSYSSLTMSPGKSTTVNLILGANSNEEEEEAKEITLKGSKSVITANGTDSVTLTVTEEGGTDVTTQCAIYLSDGTLLNTPTFTTTTAGSYTLYAERNGMRSNSITITAEKATPTGKSIVFAEGVTLTSGWYDVNKVGAGQTNGDIQMCWAASASNIIEWWQDRYVAGGGTLPSTAVTGPGKGGTYELALMDMYHSEWDVSLGGHVEQAIPWYFEGKLNGGEFASPDSQAVPLTDGGYWLSIWDSVVKEVYCGYDYFSLETFDTAYTYTVCYNNFNIWGNGTSLLGTERLKKFSTLVVEAFEHGMASLTVSLSADLSAIHHATTLWGYEIDNATGLVTRLWLTDSDDLTKEPKSKILHEYTVSIGEGKSHIQLSSSEVRYGNAWVVDITPVAGPYSAK